MNTSAIICADCSSPDPQWASINRGVLLCNMCCSVHRSLGRHISQVRSLYAPNWPPVLKEMVFTLVNKGANSLWEHGLHNSSSKVKLKKPSSRDKLHPNKNDFIIAKYKHLQMLPRLSQKDNPNGFLDLSKQLHASVRTNNLETCLRLLALGANPNFKHPDRGNTPLHVAAQAGQAMQVELLVVHGANPCSLDHLGHTPEECARIAGHHQLADRLIETQYELTDKLSFFLCGRKPVHNMGEHYLVPNVAGSGLNVGLGEANTRLQELSNELFEQLASDMYDEVDRREADAIWLTTQQLQSSIPFLPVNPSLSPLRNQGRQKLATLDAQAFAQLVVDLLLDTKRRQTISFETGVKSGTMVPSTTDDRPTTPVSAAPPPPPPTISDTYDPHDYDEVPTDENGRAVKQPQPTPPSRVPGPSSGHQIYDEVSMDTVRSVGSKVFGAGLIVSPTRNPQPTVVVGEVGEVGGEVGEGGVGASVEEMQRQLRQVMKEKEQLKQSNTTLQKNVVELQKQLNKIIDENSSLRNSVAQSPPAIAPPTSPPAMEQIQEEGEAQGKNEGNGEVPLYAQVDKSKKTNRTSARLSPMLHSPSHSPSPSPSSLLHTHSSQRPTSKSSVSSTEGVTPPPSYLDTPTTTAATTTARQDTPTSDSAFDEEGSGGATSNPPMDVVDAHIKSITQCIQDLLQAAQAHRQASFGPCSAKTINAVETMSKLFPVKPSSSEVRVSLREMVAASQRLRSECTQSGHSDIALRTRQIINSAYDVAKAARHLVLCCEQDRK